jgi:prepilin peptidase CpaA
LTLAQLLIAKLRKSEDPIEVPYGVAIAAAALWALFDTQHLVERYFNG